MASKQGLDVLLPFQEELNICYKLYTLIVLFKYYIAEPLVSYWPKGHEICGTALPTRSRGA